MLEPQEHNFPEKNILNHKIKFERERILKLSLNVKNRVKNSNKPGVPEKMFLSEIDALLTKERFFWDTLYIR